MHIIGGRRLFSALLSLGLAVGLGAFAAQAQAPNQGRLVTQPAPPNAAAYQAACQDGSVAAEIARLGAEIAQFNQAASQAQAVNDRQAVVALQGSINLDQQRLAALQGKPRCPGGPNPPPPPPPPPPPVPAVPPQVLTPPAQSICVGSGYYYTLSVRAPDGSNTPSIQQVTIAPPGVASVAFDRPSQTLTGVGLSGPPAPAFATAVATVTGYVQDVSGRIWPFQVNLTVNVSQCPPRNEGPAVIGLPPGLLEPGSPGLPDFNIGIGRPRGRD